MTTDPEQTRGADKQLLTVWTMVAVATFGTLMLLANLSTGTLIVLATGIPGSGGVVMFFLYTLLAVLARLVIGRFGAATLSSLVFGALGLAFPILGPPGFLPKLIVTLALGLLVDLSFALTPRRERWGSLLAGLLVGYAGLAMIALMFRVFLPELYPGFMRFFSIFLAINWAEGLLGGWLAWLFYRRIKNRYAVRQIRGA